MMNITSRERVRIGLNHREADMVPIDFGGMRSTGINAMAYNKLKKYLNIEGGVTKLYDVFQQLAEPEIEVLRIMNGDVVQLHRYEPAFGINIGKWKNGKLMDGSDCIVPYDYNPIRNKNNDSEIINNDKVIAKMPNGGLYFDVVHHPYENCQTKDDIDKIPIPEINATEIEFLKSEAKRLYERTSYSILGSFGGNILEAGQLDWGYEKFYMEMALNPDLIHYYLEKKTAAYLRDLEKYLAAVGEYIDVIQFGDDLGTQESLQVSLQMYRDIIKPYHAIQYEYVRNNYPTIKVFLHSCGAIYTIIPDLIDAGVQILNPVQLSANNMDAATLKREFGKELTFWGAGVSTQTTLASGSIEDIKREAKEMMEIFAPGGGFIFSQIHNIQANTSPQKIMAIYETAKQYRKYDILNKRK
ncbi:uroporphyrinogen decarboxylase family protein [Clostridium sediminicola]|uniref:uroporphyrinogen decarboxylase family protein n=1 Tax=Clostridium sediminicola TaxID=3114879 RepID=UPI0031F277C8